MPKLFFCSSWNIHLLGCSKPGFSGGGVSGQKHAQACGSSARSACWSCLSHLPLRHGGARGEALPGEPHSSSMLRKWTSLRPPSLHSSSHFVRSGAPALWACLHICQYQSGWGWEWEQHAGPMGSPSSSWLLLYAPTPVTLSASCHLLSSSSLTFPPSPMPEGLEQVSTAERFHTFNLFIHRLCVTVKSYLYHLHRISYLPGVLW